MVQRFAVMRYFCCPASSCAGAATHFIGRVRTIESLIGTTAADNGTLIHLSGGVPHYPDPLGVLGLDKSAECFGGGRDDIEADVLKTAVDVG